MRKRNDEGTRGRAHLLFSERGKGALAEQEYEELRLILNDFIREARLASCDFIPERERPEVFLLELFKSKIFYTVFDFIKRHELLAQAIMEQKKNEIKLEETRVFREWLNNSRIIIYNMILGDATPRKDRWIDNYLKEFDHSEDKVLFLDNRHIKANRDALLGQEGTHKKEPEEIYRTPEYLEECEKRSTQFDMDEPWKGLDGDDIDGDGFLIRDLAAQDVAAQLARERGGYDPDYQTPELKRLIQEKELADIAFQSWVNGEHPDIKNESDCVARIRSAFIEDKTCLDQTPSFEGLAIKLQERIDNEQIVRPDFILYAFGKKGKHGELHERLRDFSKSQYAKENYADAEMTKSIMTESELIQTSEHEEDEKEIESLGDLNPDRISPLDLLIEKDFQTLLSPAQCKIWTYVTEGKTPHEIAVILRQSERNIQKHLKNIFEIRHKFNEQN